MATRLRKTRRLRGGRHMGWGQVGQHRASGHQGGLGVTGMLKHHYSSMLKYDPNHYGHNSTKPPHPNVTKKWASVRDLDDLYARYGTVLGGDNGGGNNDNATNDNDSNSSGNNNNNNILDLKSAGYQKLLGGGSVKGAYTIKIPKFTAAAAEKVKAAGGEVLSANG